MELLNEFYKTLDGQEFSVPVLEIFIFVTFISICLLLGRHRIGLLITYCFVFYWGFIANVGNVTNWLETTSWGMPLYVISGFVMVIVALVGMWVDN